MPASEVAHTKTRFQPNPYDPKSVKIEKYKAYKYFITNAAKLMDPRIQYNGTKEELTAEVNRFADEAFAHVQSQEVKRNNESAAARGSSGENPEVSLPETPSVLNDPNISWGDG